MSPFYAHENHCQHVENTGFQPILNIGHPLQDKGRFLPENVKKMYCEYFFTNPRYTKKVSFPGNKKEVRQSHLFICPCSICSALLDVRSGQDLRRSLAHRCEHRDKSCYKIKYQQHAECNGCNRRVYHILALEIIHGFNQL